MSLLNPGKGAFLMRSALKRVNPTGALSWSESTEARTVLRLRYSPPCPQCLSVVESLNTRIRSFLSGCGAGCLAWAAKEDSAQIRP